MRNEETIDKTIQMREKEGRKMVQTWQNQQDEADELCDRSGRGGKKKMTTCCWEAAMQHAVFEVSVILCHDVTITGQTWSALLLSHMKNKADYDEGGKTEWVRCSAENNPVCSHAERIQERHFVAALSGVRRHRRYLLAFRINIQVFNVPAM